jgi:hypothetical protein
VVHEDCVNQQSDSPGAGAGASARSAAALVPGGQLHARAVTQHDVRDSIWPRCVPGTLFTVSPSFEIRRTFAEKSSRQKFAATRFVV